MRSAQSIQSLQVDRLCLPPHAVPVRIGEATLRIQDLRLALHAAPTISQPTPEACRGGWVGVLPLMGGPHAGC